MLVVLWDYALWSRPLTVCDMYCLSSLSTTLLSLGYTSRDAIAVFFAYVASTLPYR